MLRFTRLRDRGNENEGTQSSSSVTASSNSLDNQAYPSPISRFSLPIRRLQPENQSLDGVYCVNTKRMSTHASLAGDEGIDNPSYQTTWDGGTSSRASNRVSSSSSSQETVRTDPTITREEQDANDIEDEINRFLDEDDKKDKSKTTTSIKEVSPIIVSLGPSSDIEEEEEDIKDEDEDKISPREPAVRPKLNLAAAAIAAAASAAKSSDNPENGEPKNEKQRGTGKGWKSPVMISIPKLMKMFSPDADNQREATEQQEKKKMANSYLILAVRNDSPHLVERLLDKTSAFHIYTALLFSINLGRDHITKIFLDHPNYETVRQVTKLSRLGTLDPKSVGLEDPDGELGQDADDTVLSADVTPIMLAAQRNQFEVVQCLLSLGERIDEPHTRNCKCAECSLHADELRVAKTRLNTYKALASDAYIVLASTDPIFQAFELGQKLRKLAIQEKHYKADYLSLADRCSDLSGRLLDRVRDGEELDTLLNEKSGSGLSAYESLARLKLAIYHREKKFVAHPACQKKLASLWMGTLNPAWVDNYWILILFLIGLSLVYPFLAIAYWIYPRKKVAEFLRTPIVKFAASTCSYIVFICLLIGFSATEKKSSGYTLSTHPDIGPVYNNLTFKPMPDYSVRFSNFGVGTILLCIWLAGMIWENIKKLYHDRMMYFTENKFNIMDFVMLILYIVSFCLRFTAFARVGTSINYFSRTESWNALIANDSEAQWNTYWLNADRRYWTIADPGTLAEAIFGVASLLSICKLTHVLTVSERLGPLLISLAKMVEDVFAFMVIFVFIMAAFVVGFHNLFWYFYTSGTDSNVDHDYNNHFSTLADIVEQCFWSIFGLVEMEESMFNTSSQVTTITAHVMFASYNWLMVIILINMLIAMMSRSYEFIARLEDVEWKYARTKLFLEYIREDSTLAMPFNLVPTWKGVYLLNNKFRDDWCRRCAGREPKSKTKKTNNNNTPAKTVTDAYNNPNLNGKPGTALHLTTQKGTTLQKWADDVAAAKAKKSTSKEASEVYKKVIAEVVRRFIQQHGKGKSEGVEQLQQDMSSLRQELMTNIFRQNRERADLTNTIAGVQQAVTESRDTATRQHAHLKKEHTASIREVKADVSELEHQLQDVQENMRTSILELRRQMNSHMDETRIALEVMKDGIFRLCADMSALRGGSAVSHYIKQQSQYEEGDRNVGVTLLRGSGDNKASQTGFSDYVPIAVSAKRGVFEK